MKSQTSVKSNAFPMKGGYSAHLPFPLWLQAVHGGARTILGQADSRFIGGRGPAAKTLPSFRAGLGAKRSGGEIFSRGGGFVRLDKPTKLVLPLGLEPRSPASEARILSIEIREQFPKEHYCPCSARRVKLKIFRRFLFSSAI